MKKNKIYCIIVSYNAMKWIDKCLRSLLTSSLKINIVIIDNGSKDNTVTYISENYPEVHIITNTINRGFGQANNQGIEYSYKNGATHFFLLNQDAWVDYVAVEKMVEVQEKYNLALVSPVHLNGEGNLLDYNYFIKVVINEKNREYVSDMVLNKTKPYYQVFKINAAAWMLSRKTIESIGGFDPIYFHYGEDGNYCQRIKYHSKEVAFIPGSYIYHDRELQGNMVVYKKNSIIMSLLFLYSDVNNKIWRINKEKVVMHLGHFRLSLILLSKFRFREFYNIASSYITFLVRLPLIRQHTKSNKQLGPNWLDLS